MNCFAPEAGPEKNGDATSPNAGVQTGTVQEAAKPSPIRPFRSFPTTNCSAAKAWRSRVGFRTSPLLLAIIALLIDTFSLSNDFHLIVSLDPLPLRRKDGILSDLAK